jgi:predicted RNA polymerase sigma factor
MTNKQGTEVGLKRAYELASTGKYSDAAMIEAALEDEGFNSTADWINVPSIRDALTEICLSTRATQAREAGPPA